MVLKEVIMSVSLETPDYALYILRCWELHNQQAQTKVWRFILEEPNTGKRRGFASLEALTVALQNELAGVKIYSRRPD
jgi:hypothetical protein